MRRFLVLVTGLVLAVCMVAGCVGQVKTYTDSGQTIDIGVNQQFVIVLGSNLTTGYSWQETHDKAILELVEKTYQPGGKAKKGVVGAGGVDYFRFKALKTGKTEITMVYKRLWEEPSPQDITKAFAVNVE